ncbi:uncharacterized protein MONOS_16310 [Monocercomonoides exilis]|uniref:uncharacterized protein n=1 Tax=Monocercomonoides exilis TaxID=2049356 RepID=UPI003559EAF8|nr:hypothetical protein MONOS_16310 [Monocercomonoides exilis]
MKMQGESGTEADSSIFEMTETQSNSNFSPNVPINQILDSSSLVSFGIFVLNKGKFKLFSNFERCSSSSSSSFFILFPFPTGSWCLSASPFSRRSSIEKIVTSAEKPLPSSTSSTAPAIDTSDSSVLAASYASAAGMDSLERRLR